MIIGGSGSGKTNASLNLISDQDDIHKMFLYAKDLSEPKYELMQEQNILMIQMHLLSVQIQWMTFTRILTITTQAEKGRF